MHTHAKNTLKQNIMDSLLTLIDIRSFDPGQIKEPLFQSELRTKIIHHLQKNTDPLDTTIMTEQIIDEVMTEALGLGPIDLLLKDPNVSEIMINGHKEIFVEHKGQIKYTNFSFISDQSLLSIITRIISPLGRRIDETSPMVDARLEDGSRINAIIPPVSLIGPVVTIRKFEKQNLSLQGLIEKGSITLSAAKMIDFCVREKKNIMIAGGTGSGKTTLLNAFSQSITPNERIITIEDAAELKLSQKHVISLESRPKNIEDKGEISIRALLKNALRMRPDRIIIGECRSDEALDMLQAMNTGHDGSMTTLHANSPRDALSRLETMIMMAGFELPLKAIRDQIASAIDIIVYVTRFPNGNRMVTHITEVCRTEGDVILTQNIFEYDKNSKTLRFQQQQPNFFAALPKELQQEGHNILFGNTSC
ncbi:MAG: CpaF family protein [Bdellovibrionota bacterium]|nr:CpaF family protein [Deltaproteobacteria bacterium]